MQQQPCRATGLGLAFKPISKFFVVNGNAPSRFSEAIKPQEAAIFREVVASCDPTHFRKSDVPILAALCTATYLSRFYADQIGEDATAFKNYVETTKLVITLSTKLRLTPQARISAKAVGRHEPPREGPAPWEQ